MSRSAKAQSDVVPKKAESAVPLPQQTAVVVEVKEDDFQNWLTTLYDKSLMSAEELKAFWEAVSYKGFDRQATLKELSATVRDPKIAIQLILVTAIRGPQTASKLKLLNGRTSLEMGIPPSGGKGSKLLTLNKILSASADIAAYYLKSFNAPKRINLDLPGWLQFPSAGSIKLPRELRDLHREFSKKFSTLIGGVFQEQIYDQMVLNAYLDESLGLF